MPSPFDLRSRLRDAFALTPGASEARADATPSLGLTSSNASSGASMANALSGLGMARDSGASARPNPYRQFLDVEELLALMRGGLYRRIAETLPRWATWKGWRLVDDSDEAHPLQAEMRALRVSQAVRQADAWARGLGEALLWPVTLGDGGRLEAPLRVERVRGVSAVHVLDAREFSVAAWETDPRSPRYGQPSAYLLHPQRPGLSATVTVHASRVWLFGGDALPPSQWGYASVGAGLYDAVGQAMWDAIRDLSQTSAAGAHLAQELSVAVFKLGKVEEKTAGPQRNAMLEKLSFLNMTKSVYRAIFLGTADDFQRVAANPSGFKDLSENARLHLSLTTGIPIPLLFGEAPSGLSTDEKSWWANWASTVSQHQEDRYRAPLEWLCRMLYAAQGGEPEEWSLEFNALGELSEKEKAEIRKLLTEADTIAIKDRVVSADRVRRSRYGADGWSMDIQPPTPEEEALEAEPPPEPPPPVLPGGAPGGSAGPAAPAAGQEEGGEDAEGI